MSKISILVCIYKNEKNIIPFYEDFLKTIAPLITENGDDYELIMINDDSPDDSWNIMLQLARKDRRVKIIRLSRNFGAIAAAFTGLKYATGDCVTIKACDLQEPSSLTINMYQEWKKGEKIILGVRHGRKDGAISNFFSALYYKTIRTIVSKTMPKEGFDTWLMDKEVYGHVIAMNEVNSNMTLQILWVGYHPKSIYYHRLERKIGKSSWTFSKKVKYFIDSLIGFSYVPIRIMTAIGSTFSLLSIIWALVVLVSKIRGLIYEPGYSTIIIILLFSSGMIMFTLGILGEYIYRTLESSRQRPISIVRDLVNFEDERGEG